MDQLPISIIVQLGSLIAASVLFVARLESRVNDLKRDIESLHINLKAEIARKVARIEERVDKLESTVNLMDKRVNAVELKADFLRVRQENKE